MNTTVAVKRASAADFAEVLTETLCHVPYNSAAQFLEYFDAQFLPSRMGMSCVRQSIWAARRLQEKTGQEATFVRGGRHVAAIYTDEKRMSILDPYLLHQVPLHLERSAIADGVVKAVVDAWPLRQFADGTPAPAKLRAIWTPEQGTLQLDYTRYSPRRGHNFLYRSFTMPLDATASFPSPPDVVRTRLVHPEQNNLSVRVLHPHRHKLAEVILPLFDVSLQNPPRIADFISKDNDGKVSRHGQAGFGRDLELVADAIGEQPDDVLQMLLQTAHLYARVAPPERKLAAYSLENE